MLLLFVIGHQVKAQESWPGIPGLDENSFAVYSQETFLGVFGAAVLSYGLAELVFKDENLHYYQFHTGMFGTEEGTIIMENFGVEKRVAPWFGLSAEANVQQYIKSDYAGAGMGFMGYYRWYLFGKKRFSPYLEHGTGCFWGFNKFPQGGSNFTFNLTSQLGLEVTRKNLDKMRFSYGHIHHSNNGLRPENPGLDGNGFNFAYLWFWQGGRNKK